MCYNVKKADFVHILNFGRALMEILCLNNRLFLSVMLEEIEKLTLI